MATAEQLAKVSAIVNTQTWQFPWADKAAIVRIDVTPCPGSPGTPAWYIDALGAVQLDLMAIYDGDERTIDARVRNVISHGADGIPPLWFGFLAHEFAHSKWSNELVSGIKAVPTVHRIVTLFEEIRIESRAADWKEGGAVGWLRYSFKWLLTKLLDGDISTDPLALAHTWTLTYGRYVAGIAKREEIDPVDSAIRTALDDDTVDILREILEEAVVAPTIERRYELAEEWLELLKPDGEESESPTLTLILHAPPEEDEEESESEEGKSESGAGSKGDDSDDEDESAGSGGADSDDTDEGDDEVDAGGKDGDDLDAEGAPSMGTPDSVDPTDVDTDDSDADDERDSEVRDIVYAALQNVEEELDPEPQDDITTRDAMSTAAHVFKKSPSGRGDWSTRKPDGVLRAEAAKLARTLEAVSLPSIALTHKPSTLPPGRLRSREAVRQSAERSLGLMSTATPWRNAKRDRSRTKPVVVATMTDTSGSMRWAEDFVADFAWMMSTAGARVGARSAAVTYGNRAEAVTRPGEIPQDVRVRRANGGSEAFDEAAAAIEGVLHLSIPNNSAKIVFVVSDGSFVINGERERAALWLERWTKAGTLVVWIGAAAVNWKIISRKERAPGKAINLTNLGANPSKILQEMERTVLKAAAGMTM